MKVAGDQMRKRVSFMLWFRMAVQLCFLLGASSENFSFRRGSRSRVTQSPPVKLNTQIPQQVVIENGIVSVSLSNPEGNVLGISLNGMDNVLEARNERDDRGYLDVVWSEPGQHGTFQRIHGTSLSVIVENENIVEVSFLKTWTNNNSSVPMNIDQRYILRRGDSGFYSYAIFERSQGFPAVIIDQIRIVYKLNEERFHYMAVSDRRQRLMPTPRDRATGQRLAYPEAVLLTNPSNPQFKGEVDDKYQYSSLNTENTVHGWITVDSQPPLGLWMITPSNEFRNGGPTKQDLTSHVGPVILNMFVSTHYAGKGLAMSFQQGETYKKVFGPVFTYLNSASNKPKPDFHSLWSDATQQLSKEVQSWPYYFPQSKDFFQPNQRGTVTGRLQVQDRGQKSQFPNNAYIGLALPGVAGSWQTESKGYQFWSRTDGNGNFIIKNIVPGNYGLYAWVPGFIGDYLYQTTITITPGCNINLGTLVYYPPRNGPTLWEIGVPDRSAAEFYVPDPSPKFLNKLYMNDKANNFRQYGMWLRYADLYPKQDLVYNVGVDDYSKKWFFAHVTRNVGNAYKPTTWQIIFQLQNKISKGFYTLQLALASASVAEVQVRLNDPNAYPPLFTTGLIGDDSAITRHGIQGLARLYNISIASNLLVVGKNTIYLTQPRAISPFQGVMYDYIRLETPLI